MKNKKKYYDKETLKKINKFSKKYFKRNWTPKYREKIYIMTLKGGDVTASYSQHMIYKYGDDEEWQVMWSPTFIEMNICCNVKVNQEEVDWKLTQIEVKRGGFECMLKQIKKMFS